MVAVLGVASGIFFLQYSGHAGGSPIEAKSGQLYTCGMHPQVIQNQPGNCPICGMKLTPIRKQADAPAGSTERKAKYYKSTMLPGEVRQTPGKDSMGMDMAPVYEDNVTDPTAIVIDPVTIQNMGIRTGIVSNGPLRRIIRTVAMIDYDETSLVDVTTKFKGWITKLYVNVTGQLVHKGEPLFEIYSPELYSAQNEYLVALGNSNGSKVNEQSLKASALTKLVYFDISEDQIAELERSRQIKKTLRINSPRDGFVVEKMAVEGQMVKEGMRLYRLADLALVWVQAQVYEQDIAFIKLGQEALVSLSYLPDRKFIGRVTYIYPTVDEQTRTVRVRMEFHNPGYFLKPGMYATVELKAEITPSALLVPDTAVLRSGEHNTVFIALEGGRFSPRTVILGPRSENNMYQVLSGLAEGERVVISGQFMLDSESQLREAILKMLPPALPNQASAASRPAVSSSNAVPAAEKDVYVCPMPEHVSIQYRTPGQCPLCGMALVPVSPALLAQIKPVPLAELYTCPMPEHAEVRLKAPGKCPRCGMTLIPATMPAETAATNAPGAHAGMPHN